MERVLNNIIQILKDTQTAASIWDPIKNVKSFYFWDPILIPISSLPAVVVMPISANVKARGVNTDQENFMIKIKLIQNQKDYLWDSTETTQEMTQYSIRLFEERDGTSFDKIKTNSIIGALRNNYNIQPSGGQLSVHWNGNYSMAYTFVNMGDWVAYETECTIEVLRISDRT